MSKKENWQQFVKRHHGSGKSISELRDLYMAADAPPAYVYDDNADVKHDSTLEDLKADTSVFPNGISDINQKLELKQIDDISAEEEHAWRLAFELALSDEYTLTKEQLLTSHDWWINRLIQESDLDAEDLDGIIVELQNTDHEDIHQFLDHVLSKFNIEQLYAIGHPDME